jgi:hypothetical protein
MLNEVGFVNVELISETDFNNSPVTKGFFFQSLVSLYKAMGGGWVLEADHLTGTMTDSKISTHGYEVLYANQ